MNIGKKLILLFHTLRYLKPIQLYWRFYLWFVRFLPIAIEIPPPVISQFSLCTPVQKYPCFANGNFIFLNESIKYAKGVLWNDSDASKLWLYNLHYFDFINQEYIDKNVAIELIEDWIKQNPIAAKSNGWEPYTLSLRIVNWIKFLTLIENEQHLNRVQESLYLQARYLARDLEYHLLGNHLFKNGVALLYAGSYFAGAEAHKWRQKGMQIITQQVKEQVLSDGGHFERSPMYHILILEDILDCLNLHHSVGCFNAKDAEYLKETANIMLCFLSDILHQDGEIPFFNDSALRIAPSPKDVFAYAARLGMNGFTRHENDIHADDLWLVEKPDFGLYVLQNAVGRMILDAGCIGPDYLPGHAHCDTLSYELSIAGQRCIVNSGTYQYAGALRNVFRATKAHNTMMLDEQEQHEIWSTFRVARRGYPFAIQLAKEDSGIYFSAAHSGYQRLLGQPVHRREVVCSANEWLINDFVAGSGEHLAESYIHLHPDVQIIKQDSASVSCIIAGVSFVIQAIAGSDFLITEGEYSPEFGLKYKNQVLVLRKQGKCPLFLSYRIVTN